MTYLPDQGLTFENIILRVAEAAGLADQVSGTNAQIPQGGDLDIIKRAVWDGCDAFYRGVYVDPATGRPQVHRWSFLAPLVSLTLVVAGDGPYNLQSDPARYRLPIRAQGAPIAAFTWDDGSGFSGTCGVTSIERIVALHGGPTITGPPQVAAIIPLVGAPGAGIEDRRGWEVRFWPDPDRAYTVKAPFRLWPARMKELGESHIAGAQHDRAVVSSAIWEFKRTDAKDPAERETYKRQRDEDIMASILLDRENEPDILGPNIDGGLYQTNDPFAGSVGSTITINGIEV